MSTEDLNNLDERVSEVDPNTEETRTKKIIVFLGEELFKKLTALQTDYRSPSISHTVRLLIEDMWKEKLEGKPTI